MEFVSLVVLSHINKKMQEFELFKDYTMQGLLDELDIIEFYKQIGKKTRFSEITKRQVFFFKLMGVLVPGNSLL